MSDFYDQIPLRSRGAWVVHHAQKTATTVNGAAEFPALDAAGKAASLLSQLAASEETTIEPPQVEALARAAGLNPRIELPALLDMLQRRRVIDRSTSGGVAVLGLSSSATVQHAAEIFEDQDPTAEERATVAVAELTSAAPAESARAKQFLGDEFKLASGAADDLLVRSETVGFVDAEGEAGDKLYFNGNLFRRENIEKVRRVLQSLSSAEEAKVAELETSFNSRGCLPVSQVEATLGTDLFDKLKAAGMYDLNFVANPAGEHGFVTRPAAFHKFNDPMVDDAFDLAKALVAALTYGMTQSSSGRGRIEMLVALLSKLIAGGTVGPATAIGEDYRVLETRGVLHTWRAPTYGYYMKLRKRDIGQMALTVLTTGGAAETNTIDRPLPGKMLGYSGPEKSRSEFRQKKQTPASKRLTLDVLGALRTGGL